MKYFTPELYIRLQDDTEEGMDAADASWEQARARYQRRLRQVRLQLPKGLRGLLENYYLHDAEVLSMGRQGHTFVIGLRLDTPPRGLLILNYRLTEEPVINREALPPAYRSGHVEWMYDEVGLARRGKKGATHSILFSNGWEVQLCLRDVQVIPTQTLFPAPGTMLVPVPSAVPQSA
jgi:hypothetical protein